MNASQRVISNDTQIIINRVMPLVNAVDLERDVTDDIAHIIAAAGLSGTEPSDLAKKLLVLKHRGDISGDESRIILAESYEL